MERQTTSTGTATGMNCCLYTRDMAEWKRCSVPLLMALGITSSCRLAQSIALFLGTKIPNSSSLNQTVGLRHQSDIGTSMDNCLNTAHFVKEIFDCRKRWRHMRISVSLK